MYMSWNEKISRSKINFQRDESELVNLIHRDWIVKIIYNIISLYISNYKLACYIFGKK